MTKPKIYVVRVQEDEYYETIDNLCYFQYYQDAARKVKELDKLCEDQNAAHDDWTETYVCAMVRWDAENPEPPSPLRKPTLESYADYAKRPEVVKYDTWCAARRDAIKEFKETNPEPEVHFEWGSYFTIIQLEHGEDFKL